MKSIAKTLSSRKDLTKKERGYVAKTATECEQFILADLLKNREPADVDTILMRSANGNRYFTLNYIDVFRSTLFLMGKRGMIQRKIIPGRESMGKLAWNYLYYMDDLHRLALAVS